MQFTASTVKSTALPCQWSNNRPRCHTTQYNVGFHTNAFVARDRAFTMAFKYTHILTYIENKQNPRIRFVSVSRSIHTNCVLIPNMYFNYFDININVNGICFYYHVHSLPLTFGMLCLVKIGNDWLGVASLYRISLCRYVAWVCQMAAVPYNVSSSRLYATETNCELFR